MGAFSSNNGLGVREVQAKSVRALSIYFGMKFFMVRNTVKMESFDVWPLSVENESLLTCNFTSKWFQSFLKRV